MNPRKRATAKEILQHEWLKENGVASTEPISNAVVDRIKGFSAMNKMKKVALQVNIYSAHVLLDIKRAGHCYKFAS